MMTMNAWPISAVVMRVSAPFRASMAESLSGTSVYGGAWPDHDLNGIGRRHPAPDQFNADGIRGTLMLPPATDRANRQGVALDPESGILYIPSRTATPVMALENESCAQPEPCASLCVRVPGVQGLDIVNPPYGRITAIDRYSGDLPRRVTNDDTPDSIADYPASQGVDVPRTGVPKRTGLVMARTLLFADEGGGHGASPWLHAHDEQSGDIVAESELSKVLSGQSMTHMNDGKQYVASLVSGGAATEPVASALPQVAIRSTS